ncbi:DUF2334 domain-containing protein [Massilia aquatica]|uniref:DUF2334 domain-containing protein n=1 Tax=Massilia aquatica TaxID=2609000 RepID=UPI00351D9A00
MSAPPNEPHRVWAGVHAVCEAASLEERPALCVVIHDVAPATWPDCLRLSQAVREVADIPLTWLVVPRWHGSAARLPAVEAALGGLLADGHELALHGYTHLDTAAPASTWRSRFLRSVYTEGEGEFAALGVDEARRRMALGLAWFDERGWPVDGFVAPAWLLGAGAWEALRGHPFVYTTTWSHFHCLMPAGHHAALLSPSLVYAARNRTGRIVTPPAASMLAWLLRDAPLVRLALHPRDAHHPALLRHAQKLIEHLLQSRAALTKAGFAHQWLAATSTAPNTRPATSASAPAPHSSADSHSAADRRAR